MPDKIKKSLEAYGAVTNKLSFRLFWLMAMALFPLGVIAIYQTDKVLDETERLRHRELFYELTSVASEERELIQNTFGSAKGLAAIPALEDTAICRKIMADFAESNSQIAFAGYLSVSGLMECGSEGGTVDFSGSEGLRKAIAAEGPSVEVSPSGAVTGLPVLIISHPVYRSRELAGFVSLSVPLRLANREFKSPLFQHELRAVTFTDEGEVISAHGGRDAADDLLPADIPIDTLTERLGETFVALSGTGEERLYAVAGIFEDQVSVIASWPSNTSIWGSAVSQYFANLFFPFVIWMAGLGFAVFELRRLVIRNVRELRSAMRKFALGQRDDFPLELNNPPAEFAEAARAFNRMALLITESETRQAQDLKDKEVLLKEVHHRVKNNLQMIASITNMQSRSARTPEAKVMLASLQRRVSGLAMLHRSLYTSPDMLTIEGTEMLEAVIKDISTMMTDNQLRIEREIDPLSLYPDQAVPLSMLLAEALTNAMKYVGSQPDEDPYVRVTLKRHDDLRYTLSVSNSKGPVTLQDIPDENASGLGTKLMQAFVSQLEGEQELIEDDTSYTLNVRFKRRDFEVGPK